MANLIVFEHADSSNKAQPAMEGAATKGAAASEGKKQERPQALGTLEVRLSVA